MKKKRQEEEELRVYINYLLKKKSSNVYYNTKRFERNSPFINGNFNKFETQLL